MIRPDDANDDVNDETGYVKDDVFYHVNDVWHDVPVRWQLQRKETLKQMGDAFLDSNPMIRLMMQRHRSQLSFDETIHALMERIPRHNWHIPDTRDLQQLWIRSGIKGAPRIRILYLCNPQGGYELTASDDLMALSVMMPMGLSVYKLSCGEVELAHMNLGMMANMFAAPAREIFSTSARNLADALDGVVVQR